MRESFGGAFMIKLVLVFIIVYISFMAIAINYAKAFRVKNGVINILEQYKYNGEDTGGTIDKLESYLNDVNYRLPDEVIRSKCENQANGFSYKVKSGVCLISMTDDTTSPRYYRVTTYIAIDLPFFNLSMIVPVSGETKSIY